MDVILGKEALEKAKESQYDVGTIIDVQFTKKMLQNGEANYLVMKIQLDDGRVVTEQMKISYTMRSKFLQFNEGLVQCGIENIALTELVGMKFKLARMRNTFTRNGIEQTVFFRKPIEFLGKENVPQQNTNYNTAQPVVTQPVQQTVVNNAQYVPQNNAQQYQAAQPQQNVSAQKQMNYIANKIYEIVSNEPTFIPELAKKVGAREDVIRSVIANDPRFKTLNDVVYA